MTVVDTAATGLVANLFPTIARSLQLSSVDLGTLSALARLVAAPCAPAWVWLSSRIGRRWALVCASVLGGAAAIVGGFSGQLGGLIAANTLLAACTAGVAPIAHSVIADSFDDRRRSRVVGYFYGTSTLLVACTGPLIALWAGTVEGWRLGLWITGSACLIMGLVFALSFRDPGTGAAEHQYAGLWSPQRRVGAVRLRSVMRLLRIPTFRVIMVSRLMAPHLLITVFGVQFLVTERGFTNAVAALVLLPYGCGYALGAVAGGWLVAMLDRRWSGRGRIVVLQSAQVGFAAAAYAGTQSDHGASIVVFCGWCAAMGAMQALNPVSNRPILMAVVAPELRGMAFAIFFGVFDTAAWVAYTLLTGHLADRYGLQVVFLWFLVVVVMINACWLTLAYRTYPRDRSRLQAILDERRDAAFSSPAGAGD